MKKSAFVIGLSFGAFLFISSACHRSAACGDVSQNYTISATDYVQEAPNKEMDLNCPEAYNSHPINPKEKTHLR